MFHVLQLHAGAERTYTLFGLLCFPIGALCLWTSRLPVAQNLHESNAAASSHIGHIELSQHTGTTSNSNAFAYAPLQKSVTEQEYTVTKAETSNKADLQHAKSRDHDKKIGSWDSDVAITGLLPMSATVQILLALLFFVFGKRV